MLRIIRTRYKGPTNDKGSRVLATDLKTGERLVHPWDYGSDQNHFDTADALARRLGIAGDNPAAHWYGCVTEKGTEYVFHAFEEVTPRTDCERFIMHVRSLLAAHPNLSLAEAARRSRATDPALASRVLDTVGSWPSSEPEISALQALR